MCPLVVWNDFVRFLSRPLSSERVRNNNRYKEYVLRRTIGLVQSELYFDIDRNSYRFTIFEGRFKLPLIDGFDGLFVQPQTQGSGNVNVTRFSIRSHNQTEDTDTLVFRLPGFFGVFRIGLKDCFGCAYATTNSEDSSADSTAAAFSNPWSRTNTNSTAATGSDSTTGASAV
jgi:hypothetical protein